MFSPPLPAGYGGTTSTLLTHSPSTVAWLAQPSLEAQASVDNLRSFERRVEPMTRIELVTSSLPRTRSAN
jgi:hypothetical protein